MRYASLRQGLVGCWCPSVSGPFGYRLPDLSGYGNHGTPVNFSPSSGYAADGAGIALNYKIATNDYHQVTLSNQLSRTSASMTAWFKFNSKASYKSIVLTRVNPPAFGLFLSGAANNPLTGSWNNTAAEYNAATGLTINTNIWYFGAIVVNGSSLKIYKDIQSFELTITATSRNIGGLYMIGNDPESTTAQRNFDGLLDDIRIYNRALSESEIRLLASGRGVGLIPERQRNRYSAPAPTSRNRSSRFLSFPA